MGKWRLAWRRAMIRREAERQGASREAALTLANVLYPLPGQEPVTIIDLSPPVDPAPGVRPFDPNGPYA